MSTRPFEKLPTIRGKLGYAWGPALIYATGGAAISRISNGYCPNASVQCYIRPAIDIGGGWSDQGAVRTGWTAGGGLEYALATNVSLKAEYLYVNLGSGDTINVVTQSTLPASPPAAPSSFTAAYSRTDFNIVRVGLNYKFGNYYAPVVTK